MLSIGIASWVARGDARTPVQLGMLAGVLAYNALGAVVVVFAEAVLGMAGLVLWPAVVYNAALAAWCVTCLPPMRAAGHL